MQGAILIETEEEVRYCAYFHPRVIQIYPKCWFKILNAVSEAFTIALPRSNEHTAWHSCARNDFGLKHCVLPGDSVNQRQF